MLRLAFHLLPHGEFGAEGLHEIEPIIISPHPNVPFIDQVLSPLLVKLAVAFLSAHSEPNLTIPLPSQLQQLGS